MVGQRRDGATIEALADLAEQDVDRLVEIHAGPPGARADHADEGVGDGDDARRQQDLVALQPLRAAAAVVLLLKLAQRLLDGTVELDEIGRASCRERVCRYV